MSKVLHISEALLTFKAKYNILNLVLFICGLNMKRALTLVEMLITMAIISFIFTLTLPILNTSTYKKEVIDGFNTFNSDLENAIKAWKTDFICPFNAGKCIVMQRDVYQNKTNFNQIGKYLNIYKKIDKNTNDISLLPLKTLDYSGKYKSTYDFRTNKKRDVYLLSNGIIFSVLSDNDGYWIIVDTNGKKPPNRIGKDTFHLTIGYDTNSDINYFAKNKTDDGICGHLKKDIKINCDANNLDPNTEYGASPTAYFVLNGKLPDFVELSKNIPNFKP